LYEKLQSKEETVHRTGARCERFRCPQVQRDNWRGLYMVLDVVAESYNGPKELLKQDFVAKYKSDIENFKHHANNYRALGVEARHGLAKEKPPKKKMTLAEAQALIQNILSDWVEKLKVRQLIHNLVDFS
jgi:hypothetical protein